MLIMSNRAERTQARPRRGISTYQKDSLAHYALGVLIVGAAIAGTEAALSNRPQLDLREQIPPIKPPSPTPEPIYQPIEEQVKGVPLPVARTPIGQLSGWLEKSGISARLLDCTKQTNDYKDHPMPGIIGFSNQIGNRKRIVVAGPEPIPSGGFWAGTTIQISHLLETSDNGQTSLHAINPYRLNPPGITYDADPNIKLVMIHRLTGEKLERFMTLRGDPELCTTVPLTKK